MCSGVPAGPGLALRSANEPYSQASLVWAPARSRASRLSVGSANGAKPDPPTTCWTVRWRVPTPSDTMPTTRSPVMRWSDGTTPIAVGLAPGKFARSRSSVRSPAATTSPRRTTTRAE